MTQRTRPLTFLLYGITGVYNYGCEAIVRGTTMMLRERWPDCRVIYASYRAAYDRQALHDVEGLDVVPAFRKYGMMRIRRALIRRIMPGRPLPWLLNPALIKESDVVLSIGGDIYTLTGKERGSSYYHPLAELGERILNHYHRPYILWGASVGPFDSFPPSVTYFSEHLRQIPLITAREPRTKEYLKELGCESNVVLVADPAFLMDKADWRASFDIQEQDVLIAVNLSPLSLRHVFRDEQARERRKAILAESIRGLLGFPNAKIILTPHVVEETLPYDDDYSFLRGIYDLTNVRDGRVILLPENLGARRTKAILSMCHLAIAARMHCGIAAVSSGVPTLFVGYSEKAGGMVRYVYGNDDWLLQLNELNPENLRQLVVQMLNRRRQIAGKLKYLGPKWQEEARRAVDALAGVI